MKKISLYSCFQLHKMGELDELCSEILTFDEHKIRSDLSKKVVGIFLNEPSSRTRFSVESAAYRLGAKCMLSLSFDQTSIAKGESYGDSSKIWSKYCDLICVRHSHAGFANLLSRYSEVPVLNLGDGFLEHPTQGLSTLIHAHKLFGSIKDVNICIWGDIELSRCAHSVMIAFALMGASVWLCPAAGTKVPANLINMIIKVRSNARIFIISDLAEVRDTLQIIYLNRLQSERRNVGIREYAQSFTIDCLKALTTNGIVLHPLPRGIELTDSLCRESQVKILEHVEITYKTRLWLLYYYLSNINREVLQIAESPFSIEKACNQADCASLLFPMALKPDKKPGTLSLCSSCYREVQA